LSVRIVSLIPSATEIVALLGAEHDLVGRSHECDHPVGLDHAQVLTSAKTAFDPDSGHGALSVDASVREMVQDSALSLYELDETALAALRPDLIITQDLCAVCSIDRDSVERACAAIPSDPALLALDPGSIEDILDDIVRVGKAIGRERAAMDAIVSLTHRMDRALEHVNPYDDGPVLGFMEWTEPIYCAGHWSVQIIERAGARHPLNPTRAEHASGTGAGLQMAQRRAGASIAIEPDAFVASDPQILVVSPCGLTLEQSRRALSDLRSRAPWFDDLPAVRAGRVAIVDGNQMFNRPGPRVIDALEFMVGFVNDRPELIPEGFPWSRL
jgi:iron complex transport system substrate-binding protein